MFHVDSFPMMSIMKNAKKTQIDRIPVVDINCVDQFGRTALIAAIRQKEKRRAFILLTGGCDIRFEKYIEDSEEVLVEICKATSALYEFYMKEIEHTPKLDIVRDVIWNYLFFWSKQEVIALKKKVDDFVEEHEVDTFWGL